MATKESKRPAARNEASPTLRAGLFILFSCIVAVSLWYWHVDEVEVQATARLSLAQIDSDEGRLMVRRFESLGGADFTRRDGPAVFMDGEWNIKGDFDRSCQLQLAVHAGDAWQLFAWTSDHAAVNGTINSWGTVLREFDYLSIYGDAITLATTDSGQFVLAWQTPTGASDVRIVRARLVYACGDNDSSAQVFDVSLTVV